MKKIILLVPMLFGLLVPTIYLPIDSKNIDSSSNKINLESNSLYDKQEVYNAFEYSGFQTIQAGKEPKQEHVNPDPWITWTENINIKNINSTNITFDDFESIKVSLSGQENNYIYDAAGTLGNAEADEIYTKTTWGPMVTTEQVWANKDENGNYTTRIAINEENKDEWISAFTNGGAIGNITFNQVMDRIPKMHNNNLYEVYIPITSLDKSNTYWEQPFTKTNNEYSLDYSRTTTHSDGETSAFYNGRSYWDWLNHSFQGIGHDTINSNASSASSSGVFEYDISLVDSEGTIYGMQYKPSLISPPIQNIIVEEGIKVETNSKDSRIGLSFAHDYGNLLDYEVYNIQVKVEDLNNNLILDWTDFDLNETISTDLEDPSEVYLKFKNQDDLFILNEEYIVSIQNTFDTSQTLNYDTKQQISVQVTASEFTETSSSYAVAWWIWLIVSFVILFLLIGISFSIFKPIQLIKRRRNNNSLDDDEPN